MLTQFCKSYKGDVCSCYSKFALSLLLLVYCHGNIPYEHCLTFVISFDETDMVCLKRKGNISIHIYGEIIFGLRRVV